MSNKLSYAEMKFIFYKNLDNMFHEDAKGLHGWAKEEFLDCFQREMQCDMDEEISFAAPLSLEVH